MSAGGQDIYTTQRKNHEAKLRAKDKEIERLETALGKCRESRLAETIRDIPEVKKAFDDVKRLEIRLAALADVANVYMYHQSNEAELESQIAMALNKEQT